MGWIIPRAMAYGSVCNGKGSEAYYALSPASTLLRAKMLAGPSPIFPELWRIFPETFTNLNTERCNPRDKRAFRMNHTPQLC